MPRPTIIVHGGAGAIQPQVWQEYKTGVHRAAQCGQRALDAGATALDAAIEAVVAMEDDPTFNAGTGSCLTRAGVVECDALVMRDDLTIGAVACVSGVRNPVLLARAVMEGTAHHLVGGPAALDFARSSGIELCDPADLVIERRRKRWEELIAMGAAFHEQFNPEEAHDDPMSERGEGATGDTVGACAMDAAGRIAVAASTGGIMLKLPGRVGDTPLVGCGSYCGPAGAATCTGHGESAMRVCLAKYVYDLLACGQDALSAARHGVEHAVRAVDGKIGVIVLDTQGNRAWATSTMRIAAGVPEHEVDATEGSIAATGS